MSAANARGMTIAIPIPGSASVIRNVTADSAAMTSAAVPAVNVREKTKSAMNMHVSACRTVPGEIAAMTAAAARVAPASPDMNVSRISV